MKTTSMHRLLFVAVASVAALAFAAGPDWDSESTKRKADYMFLEAQNAYVQERYDDYITLTMRAYELDSADLDIASEWAMIQLLNQDADSLTNERAFQYMCDRFYSQPEDYNLGAAISHFAYNNRKFGEMIKIWTLLDSLNPKNPQPARELANAYLLQSILNDDSAAYDQALAMYNRVEKTTGKNTFITSKKVAAYMLRGDTVSIIREIDELVESAPNDCNVAYFAGMEYGYLNDWDKALEYFNRSCELDSTYGPAYLARAELYNQKGDSVGFDREVFRALQSPNLELDSKLEILRSYVSQLYQDSTQEQRIRDLFAQLEQMHSGEADIHNLYASYLYVIDDLPGAAEEFTYSVALNPNDGGTWQSLVQLLGQIKDDDRLIQYASQAKELFPDDIYFPIMEAMGYRNKEDVPAAIAVLDSVPEQPGNPRAMARVISFKGDLYTVLGDTLQALEYYDQALKLDPEDAMALNNAAYFMALQDIDLDKAEQYSARAVRLEPDNPTYLDTYAWVFFKKKDYSMARNYIDMTLNLYNSQEPDESGNQEEDESPSVDVLEHAGDIYFMCGEPDKAIEFWEKAYKLDPDNELLMRKVKHKTFFFK